MKKRIFQIAKELNISHLEIMSFLKDNDIPVSSHMAPVEKDVYETILNEFSKEKQQIDRLRKEKARQAIVNEITEKENELSLEEKKESSSNTISNENTVGLKILKRPEVKLKEETLTKKTPPVKEKNDKEEKSSVVLKEISRPSPKRKLKQIDISAIAEKINLGKKEVKTT